MRERTVYDWQAEGVFADEPMFRMPQTEPLDDGPPWAFVLLALMLALMAFAYSLSL